MLLGGTCPHCHGKEHHGSLDASAETADNFLEDHMNWHELGNEAGNWDEMEVLDSSYEMDGGLDIAG